MFEPDHRTPENADEALYFVFRGGELVTDMRAPEPCLLPREQVRFLGSPPVRQQFLGYYHGKPVFARELPADDQLDAMQYQVGNLYQVLGRVSEEMFALAGRALQLLAWERDNQFCGRCGADMANHAADRAMHCEPCASVIYPRISPCIITLVTRGEELLLARNANFPIEMYSTLAGFIEAGETAEECLVREVKEEVGVDVGEIRYFRSQSWPFPNQLMLGFFAEYTGGDIVCTDDEIAEAYWFKPDQLPTIPPIHSISGQLIQHHVEQYTR
jgi:NAD+ diphosphatase